MPAVAERIRQFNSNRIPFYTAIKYKLMTGDPFVFFRGTCHLFYEDLHRFGNIPVSPGSWISGDLHLENFGSYKGDNRLVYFDITDFDEAILAPATWELARIVTSIFIALDTPGGAQKSLIAVAKLFVETYAGILKKGKARYIEQKTATGITKLFLDKVCERKQKDLVLKRTMRAAGKLRLKVDDSKLFAIDPDLKKELTDHLKHWLQECKMLVHVYKILDAGFRVAGTGSIGIKRYLFLLKEEHNDHYLLIDMKQARKSSLQPFLTIHQPGWTSEAERITEVQRRMQNIPPALLGTTIFKNESYVIKEMQPTEDKIQFRQVRNNIDDVDSVVRDMALITASAQLRSSGRQGAANADALVAFGNETTWQSGITDYARSYFNQVKKDYAAYLKAYEAGFFK